MCPDYFVDCAGSVTWRASGGVDGADGRRLCPRSGPVMAESGPADNAIYFWLY